MKIDLNLKPFMRSLMLCLLLTGVFPVIALNLPKESAAALLHAGESDRIFNEKSLYYQTGQDSIIPSGSKLLAIVTCYVSLSTGDAPIGTIVSLTGQEIPFNNYSLTVPESGIVVFPEILEGNYILQASKPGFETYQILTGINSSSSFDVLLLELRYKPLNLTVDSLTLIATWDKPRDILINEDFEGADFPPAGWQVITQNFTGWYNTTDGSSSNFVIPLHSTYAVVSDEADNGNGCCDYLMMAAIDLTNNSSYRLNFASFYTGTYSQSAYIELSSDAGVTWTVVHTMSPYPIGWQNFEVDLASYSGQNGLNNVIFAFHADDNGEWASAWAVDDIRISSGIIPALGYILFLDGDLPANTTDTTYTFHDLTFGQEYVAGVSALFSSGYSELDTFRFVSAFLFPPQNFQANMPANTDYAHLWWEQPFNASQPGIPPPGLIGFNIYRNSDLLATVGQPTTEYYDLTINPGFHNYHIAAVYDLAFYGVPGETGESMIEGPVDLAYICCQGLPFIENFNTGLFETNQWIADPGNWRIAGQTGNDAPSAEFYTSSDTVDYSQSLTGYYIIGIDIIDGRIMLDFDLKHTLVNPTGAEFLAVEIFDGSSWIEVAEYSNTGSFDWETKRINITRHARGHIFNLRFRAYGINSTDIADWLVDNIQVYRECLPPKNPYCELNFPHINQILLSWEAPEGSNGFSAWLAWDDGVNQDAIGVAGGGTFSAAVRFTAVQLAAYAGTSLTKIRMFPYAAGGTIVLKVWSGANAGQLLVSQQIPAYTAGIWNDFSLITPVPVTGNTELWFGYTVSHGADYIAGCDSGPAVAGFGDLISLDGLAWVSMATAYSLNFNWNIEGFVENIDVSKALEPIADKTVYGPATQLVRGYLPVLPNATVTNTTGGNRELSGYNVWRDDVFLASTAETVYYDEDFQLGNNYCYKVTAVYEDCESSASAEAWYYGVGIAKAETDQLTLYPNPSNSVVNIGLTGDISQVVVYNYVGQVVYERIITSEKTILLNVRNYEAGAYLVKFVTNSGENFTKKVVVTK